MTATAKRARILAQIEQHGHNVLTIFPNADERDPVKLCKKLRRLECQAAGIGLRLCNGPEFNDDEQAGRMAETILDRLDVLLGWRLAGVPVFVNLDPRGYALKIDSDYFRSHDLAIHSDMGGYGILAPEFDGTRFC